MCDRCDDEPLLPRRQFLKFAAAGLVAAGFAGRAYAAGEPTEYGPDEALEFLKEGNARYVAEPELCRLDLAEQRAAVSKHQSPWATILSCADSRAPPELLYGGVGVGELFVCRNAGNLADTATLGTIEYGAAVLGSPLIVVLGHTACGAVKAACDVVTKNATYPGSIGPMIEPIVPAALAVRKDAGDFVLNTTLESAKRTAKRLPLRSDLINSLVGEGKVKIVAGIYDLESGAVTYIE